MNFLTGLFVVVVVGAGVLTKLTRTISKQIVQSELEISRSGLISILDATYFKTQYILTLFNFTLETSQN